MQLADAPAPPTVQSPLFQTGFGPAWIVNTAEEIPSAVREQLFAHHCKDFRFYEVVEQTLPGQFHYRYLVLENSATGEVAVQPFFFVEQDLLAGLPESWRGLAARLRARWPRLLTMRILMVGCASGEGQLGLTVSWLAEALHEALELFAPQSRAAIILLKDFPASYRDTLTPFSSNGYSRVPSMPAAQLELDFPTFEVFLQQRLGKVFRKSLRRKFRSAEAAPKIEMEVTSNIEPIAAELHALYLQTHLRSTFRFEQLTPDYFIELGRRMSDRVRFFIWRQSGRIIAFNLCMVHERTIYDLEVGLDYAVALDLHLYFVTWRDIISWSLAHDIERYHTGPLNYDPKLHLRLRLAPQDLYARHTSRWLNPFFKLAMRYLQPARHDPLLRRFPNAHEL